MTACILLAPVLFGVDVGWQPLPTGGMEYIIQIDPATLDALKAGEAVQSDVPGSIGRVRTYRVIVGSGGGLPREQPPAEPQTFTPPRGEVSELKRSADASPSSDDTPPEFDEEAAESPPAPPAERQATFRTQPAPADTQTARQETTSHSNTPQRLAGTGGESDSPHRTAAGDRGDRPWWALMLTLAALAGSLTGNVYLFWILRQAHRRYRNLAAMQDAG
ncbi:MAG: hypothetical protein ACOC46_02350 [Pirellulales bacterium]